MSLRYACLGIVHDMQDAEKEISKQGLKETTIDIYFQNKPDHVVYTAALQIGEKQLKLKEKFIPLWGSTDAALSDMFTTVEHLEDEAQRAQEWLVADGIDVKVRKYLEQSR